jgi:hypothetical protein
MPAAVAPGWCAGRRGQACECIPGSAGHALSHSRSPPPSADPTPEAADGEEENTPSEGPTAPPTSANDLLGFDDLLSPSSEPPTAAQHPPPPQPAEPAGPLSALDLLASLDFGLAEPTAAPGNAAVQPPAGNGSVQQVGAYGGTQQHQTQQQAYYGAAGYAALPGGGANSANPFFSMGRDGPQPSTLSAPHQQMYSPQYSQQQMLSSGLALPAPPSPSRPPVDPYGPPPSSGAYTYPSPTATRGGGREGVGVTIGGGRAATSSGQDLFKEAGALDPFAFLPGLPAAAPTSAAQASAASNPFASNGASPLRPAPPSAGSVSSGSRLMM